MQDPDDGDVSGALHVGPAAQLTGVVAQFDDPNPIAVLLPEESDGPERFRLRHRCLEDMNRVVLRQEAVGLELGLHQDIGGNTRGMREVEPKTARRHE